MPAMWELPAIDSSVQGREPLFTVRHSITVTDYLVKVVAQSGLEAVNGQWIKKSKVHKLPITGLTKKILRKAQIIE
jgi:hypothetical protein